MRDDSPLRDSDVDPELTGERLNAVSPWVPTFVKTLPDSVFDRIDTSRPKCAVALRDEKLRAVLLGSVFACCARSRADTPCDPPRDVIS